MIHKIHLISSTHIAHYVTQLILNRSFVVVLQVASVATVNDLYRATNFDGAADGAYSKLGFEIKQVMLGEIVRMLW